MAAAGGHNIILIGARSGKSMLAKRLPSILPRCPRESLETTKIHSVAGRLQNNTGLISKRPFRDPHHTISTVAMTGGGSYPQPGEISLAHNGIFISGRVARIQSQRTGSPPPTAGRPKDHHFPCEKQCGIPLPVLCW